MSGNPCCERSFQNFSWEIFYQETSSSLNQHELCDCWRGPHGATVENRRYFHPTLHTHLIFIWFGTSPILMRKDFSSKIGTQKLVCPSPPLSTAFAVQNSPPSCQPNLTALFDTMSLSEIVENATLTFHPHLLILNWGHHHTYRTTTLEGKHVGDELTATIQKLKLLQDTNTKTTKRGNTATATGKVMTRFIFKTTAPFCENHFKKTDADSSASSSSTTSSRPPLPSSYSLHCDLQPLDLKVASSLLSYHLITQRVLEMFDLHTLIQLLAKALPSFRDPSTGALTLNETTPLEQAYPLYWDRLHPHCWVMTQLNRAMVASFFTSSRFDGVIRNLTNS
jgi:hypothetical protein